VTIVYQKKLIDPLNAGLYYGSI